MPWNAGIHHTSGKFLNDRRVVQILKHKEDFCWQQLYFTPDNGVIVSCEELTYEKSFL